MDASPPPAAPLYFMHICRSASAITLNARLGDTQPWNVEAQRHAKRVTLDREHRISTHGSNYRMCRQNRKPASMPVSCRGKEERRWEKRARARQIGPPIRVKGQIDPPKSIRAATQPARQDQTPTKNALTRTHTIQAEHRGGHGVASSPPA